MSIQSHPTPQLIGFDRELPEVLANRIRKCLELTIIETNLLGPEELGLNDLHRSPNQSHMRLDLHTCTAAELLDLGSNSLTSLSLHEVSNNEPSNDQHTL